MNLSSICAATRLALLTLFAALFLSACGSSSSSDTEQPVDPAPVATTGIVGLLFTDEPTDMFREINLNVVQAILIGEDGHQEMVFEGSEPVNLLDLENFSEPVMFGEVQVGTYTKLRLVIDDLELVPLDENSDPIYPKLPANGKIDLLQPEGFDVLPGRTLLIEIDMDANKSIKITGAGKSGNVQFRPVVKVKISDGDGDTPYKLVRLEGSVSDNPGDPANTFELCDIDSPDYCVKVSTDTTTSFFDAEGTVTDFGGVTGGAMAVVIGQYVTDPEIVLSALIVEIGGNAEQVKGHVVSDPDPVDGTFLLLAADDNDLVIELQPGTKYFDKNGVIGADAIVLGVDVEIEGVLPTKDNDEDPDLMRAALVFLEADDDEQISGTIIAPIVEPTETTLGNFGLTLTEGGDTCVDVQEGADILLVDEANSEVTMGTFANLEVDKLVDVFGTMPETGCFVANEIIVEVVAETP